MTTNYIDDYVIHKQIMSKKVTDEMDPSKHKVVFEYIKVSLQLINK